VLLGLIYAVIEEAFVTQSLFNPNYLGLRLLDYGYSTVLELAFGGLFSSSNPYYLEYCRTNCIS
jgi:hypothetical protein